MTTSRAPAPGPPAADWAGEIGAFAALLEAVECQLDDGVDRVPLPDWQPPRPLDAAPTHEELVRARELVERAEWCRAALESQLRATAAALDDLSRRRTAAHRYGSTT